MTAEEKLQFEKNILDGCKSKEGATDDDVKGLLDRNIPTAKTGKCLLACAHETLEMVIF